MTYLENCVSDLKDINTNKDDSSLPTSPRPRDLVRQSFEPTIATGGHLSASSSPELGPSSSNNSSTNPSPNLGPGEPEDPHSNFNQLAINNTSSTLPSPALLPPSPNFILDPQLQTSNFACPPPSRGSASGSTPTTTKKAPIIHSPSHQRRQQQPEEEEQKQDEANDRTGTTATKPPDLKLQTRNTEIMDREATAALLMLNVDRRVSSSSSLARGENEKVDGTCTCPNGGGRKKMGISVQDLLSP